MPFLSTSGISSTNFGFTPYPTGTGTSKPSSPLPQKQFFGKRSHIPAPPTSPLPQPPKVSSRNASDPLVRPPTTNLRHADDRADLIRKSRKLAQVFGTTPPAVPTSQSSAESSFPRLLVPDAVQAEKRHKKGNLSVSTNMSTSESDPAAAWPPHDSTVYLSGSGRRHSEPASPDYVSFLVSTHDSFESKDPHEISQNDNTRTSFIDFMEDCPSTVSLMKRRKQQLYPDSPSQMSMFDNMSPEELAELDRKRKKEKLSKLHRFLGSRVPTNLVLGMDGTPLPFGRSTSDSAMDSEVLTRRRRSSVSVIPAFFREDLSRLKEGLDDKEKARNVRRAQKMEKVFGELPPQVLYHTRHYPSVSDSYIATSPKAKLRYDGTISPFETSPTTITVPKFNLNQSSFHKNKKRENHWPSISESTRGLLADDVPNMELEKDEGLLDAKSVYSHYQHSLTTLDDILEREDRTSLAELHEYLHGSDEDPSVQFPLVPKPSNDRRASDAASVKSERRRSLPTRTSIVSLSFSDYSVMSHSPVEPTSDFNLRRRKAAKLTQFFGVDYRVLIQDVLESIEKGVEEESKRGTLNADQAADLLRKLRALKAKRVSLV